MTRDAQAVKNGLGLPLFLYKSAKFHTNHNVHMSIVRPYDPNVQTRRSASRLFIFAFNNEQLAAAMLNFSFFSKQNIAYTNGLSHC